MPGKTGIFAVNSLEVVTDIGKCQIQLCVGDITALSKEDEVDVLVISAFPGIYSPTRSSLIGQLHLRLNISVRQLANDKEEDLRKLYSCWWSKPLPDHLSFRKILCFEARFNAGSKVGKVVGHIFRCLVPVLASKEGRVIMPIVASGYQNFSKTKMLKLLVNAAVHWMKAGLPLRSLKIVLFSRDISKISKADEPLVELFQTLKETHEGIIEDKTFGISKEVFLYDVYLSYSEDDKNSMTQVVDGLIQNKSDVRVFSAIQELDVEDSWQDKLYDTITKCKRVMALITPSFLQSARCTEQYNIALCHSRRVYHAILVPLYVSEVPYMPTYMKLTQYIDCRFNFSEKLETACITVISYLSLTPLETTAQGEVNKTSSPAPENYDVFLSYSHCNGNQAKKIMKELRSCVPDINIFVDTAELKAGSAWQQTLYHALDCSKVVIALISNDYLRSKVCIEELNLAVAIQLQDNCKVLPLIIEPLEENVEWLSLLSPINCLEETSQNEISTTAVCKAIVKELQDVKGPPNKLGFAENMKIKSLASVLEDARSLFFQDHFASLVVPPDHAGGRAVGSCVISPKNASTNVDIYIISSSDDSQHCQLLQRLILSQDPSLIIKKSSDENNSVRLTFLDEARLIIPLLSSSYLESPELVHELNIAWCRQRYSSNLCFLAITLDKLRDRPTYVHLFPCFFNCDDNQWTENPANLKQFPANELSHGFATCESPLKVLLCFVTAANYLHQWLEEQECTVAGLHNKFINYVHLSRCIQRSKAETPQEQSQGKNDATVGSAKKVNFQENTVTNNEDEFCIQRSKAETPQEQSQGKNDAIVGSAKKVNFQKNTLTNNKDELCIQRSKTETPQEQSRGKNDTTVGSAKKVNFQETTVTNNEEELCSNLDEHQAPNYEAKAIKNNEATPPLDKKKSGRNSSSSTTCLIF